MNLLPFIAKQFFEIRKVYAKAFIAGLGLVIGGLSGFGLNRLFKNIRSRNRL